MTEYDESFNAGANAHGQAAIPEFTYREVALAFAMLAVMTDNRLDNVTGPSAEELKHLALRCRILWAQRCNNPDHLHLDADPTFRVVP